MRRELMEEASMTVTNPVLVGVIESSYFYDHSTYMLIDCPSLFDPENQSNSNT